jgi:hypothetical protein
VNGLTPLWCNLYILLKVRILQGRVFHYIFFNYGILKGCEFEHYAGPRLLLPLQRVVPLTLAILPPSQPATTIPTHPHRHEVGFFRDFIGQKQRNASFCPIIYRIKMPIMAPR